MDKVEFTLPTKSWEGMNTRFPADTNLVGPDQFTEGSKNFITTKSGTIEKPEGGVFYNASALTLPIKDQYEAVFTNGVRHMLVMESGELHFTSGNGAFTSVTSGYNAVANMEFSIYRDRVYFGNGVNDPQTYDTVASYGGSTPITVPATKDMGAQAPTVAPTFNSIIAGAVPDATYDYKVTFLYYDSEESNGNTTPLTYASAGGPQGIRLNIPLGGYGVTARKVYRAITGSTDLRLVATVLDNTTTTADDIATLGTLPIPLGNGVPPSFALITTHLDRLWAAGVADSSSTLYWSEAGLPNIWRSTNFILCNPKDPIVGLVVYNDRVIVFNRNSIGQVLGRTSDQFRYSEISPNVGCADGRSIQTRTLRGVPSLIWLSDGKVYSFNGQSIVSIAEEIEDQLRLNIQQALQVKGKNSQTSATAFAAGTPSDGINLVSDLGAITLRGYQKEGVPSSLTTDPTRVWDTQAEWEDGSDLANIATKAGSQLRVPIKHSPLFSEGSHNNTQDVGGTLQLPIGIAFTGESETAETVFNTADGGKPTRFANPIIPQRSGTMTQWISVDSNDWTVGFLGGSGPRNITFKIWTDSSGAPGTELFSGPVTDIFAYTGVENPSFGMTGGVKYWVGYELTNLSLLGFPARWSSSAIGASGGLGDAYIGGWGALIVANGARVAFNYSYSFVSNVLANSGIWTGPVYDSLSEAALSDLISHTGSFPSGSSSTTTVEGSDSADMLTALVTEDFASLNGSTSISLAAKRYWRIKIKLDTPSELVTPAVGLPSLLYSTTGAWTSEVIDHTVDITTLDSLVMNSTTPAGTTAIIEIATSTDNISYSAYTALGSATPERYSKVRVTLTTDAGNTTTATVTSSTFTWSLTGTFISSAIDTGATPAGWELFQSSFTELLGTIVFSVRTAATEGALSGASWVPTSNGEFIIADIHPFIQYRAVMSGSSNDVPTIDSVVINWYISIVDSIRVASLFYNSNYYLAAAEFDNANNNVVFVYDEGNTWKFFKDINVNTFGTFFTDAYYGDSTIGKVVKWFQGTTNQGTNIEMDVRTKAFSQNLGDESKTKYMRTLIAKLTGTGATLQFSYSVDGGVNFKELVDIDTGLNSYTSPNDGLLHVKRFTTSAGTVLSGRTILIRVFNNDDKTVKLHTMRLKAWISPREVING